VKAFFNIIEDNSFEAGSQALMQLSGLGKLRPNMILMGYKANWRTCDREELQQYFNVIQLVTRFFTEIFMLTLSL
jgi:solute carrier family 12 sodium/potassium/chloride transporter 2